MDKQEFLRANRVSQMPKLVQVMAGRLYDAAFEAGRQEGYRQGVYAYIAKEAEVHKRLYDQGAQDANHWGSAAFIAAACSVMHQLAGWGGRQAQALCGRYRRETGRHDRPRGADQGGARLWHPH